MRIPQLMEKYKGNIDAQTAQKILANDFSFLCRWGSSCGKAFWAEEFLELHPQYEYLRPFLKDRPTQLWISTKKFNF